MPKNRKKDQIREEINNISTKFTDVDQNKLVLCKQNLGG